MSDLEGKKVGTKIGSTSYDFLTKNLDDNDGVTPYPGSSDMYMALMSGAVDAVFYDAPNVGYFASTRGAGKVKTVGPLYEGQQYGIALKKGSEWVGPVNEALAEIKEDGTYKTIDRKSTRLNSSHVRISYAVFCLKKKTYAASTREAYAITHTTWSCL